MGCTSSSLQAHTFDNFVGEREPSAPGKEQRKALVIANPYSGSKSGKKALELINKAFGNAGITSILKETQHAGHAEEIVQSTDLSDVDMLVSIGGDGTCHEIVNGLLGRQDAESYKHVTISIIPCGTGNTVAYDLGIVSVEDAIQKTIEGNKRIIDVMECTNHKSTSTSSKEDVSPDWKRYAINIVGGGLSPAVLQVGNKMRWLGKGVRYEFAAYIEVLSNKAYECTIEFPEDETTVDAVTREVVKEPKKYTIMQAQNTIFMGEKVPFAPKAKLDDGLIDLVLISFGTRIAFVNTIDAAKKNKHLEGNNVTYIQCKEFTMTPTTKEQCGKESLNIDGDLYGSLPVRVKCLKQVLNVIC